VHGVDHSDADRHLLGRHLLEHHLDHRQDGGLLDHHLDADRHHLDHQGEDQNQDECQDHQGAVRQDHQGRQYADRQGQDAYQDADQGRRYADHQGQDAYQDECQDHLGHQGQDDYHHHRAVVELADQKVTSDVAAAEWDDQTVTQDVVMAQCELLARSVPVRDVAAQHQAPHLLDDRLRSHETHHVMTSLVQEAYAPQVPMALHRRELPG
jgi:hypothetical protein